MPFRLAPLRLASVRLAPLSFAYFKPRPLKSRPLKSALVKSSGCFLEDPASSSITSLRVTSGIALGFRFLVFGEVNMRYDLEPMIIISRTPRLFAQ